MPPRRPFTALLLFLSLLSGCAAQNAGLPPAALAGQKADFTSGYAMLSCNLGCVSDYGFHRKDMKKLYDAGDWNGLSGEVLNIGEDIDQGWFYLGASAEGLGDDEAAQRYYFISLISPFQCRRGLNVCDGLDLPALTEQRLTALDAKLAASPEFAQLAAPPGPPGAETDIHLLPGKGLFQVPALLDGKIPLLFAVDSGSSGVTIPEGLAVLMFDKGLMKKSDIVGVTHAVMGNGSVAPVIIFHIASLRVGGVVLKNVIGGITPGPGELLLGQTFLNRFKSWSIDNSRQMLVLQPE